MNRNFYMVIEGVIGVGKTTLVRLLRPTFQAGILLELFEENPFLSSFYSDRARYAFQTQIFFLLSRYRQQRQTVTDALTRCSLISDYSFAKDSLFAHLNLDGDELAMYTRVHDILAENIPSPDLVVYLRASTEALLDRIAIRDRPYERGMDRDYIKSLRQAYERFFADYEQTAVLVIDTDDMDFVKRPQDLAEIESRIRSALGMGVHQPALLPVGPALTKADRAVFDQGQRRLADFQRWHQALDKEKGFLPDIYFNFICLTEEIGELGAALAHNWRAQATGRQSANQAALREELADCLAYLLKLSNYAGIDLEQAYLQKMNVNRTREW